MRREVWNQPCLCALKDDISLTIIFCFCQERTIERLKEQRDRDEREKQEEIDNYKKDMKDLKEKVSVLQADLTEKEVNLRDAYIRFGIATLNGIRIVSYLLILVNDNGSTMNLDISNVV